LQTRYATGAAIEESVQSADLIVGSVLVPGASAPKLVTEAMVRRMQAGSVVVDVAIDQGGCFETSRPTTHEAPHYLSHDVVHYCVANMPGAVPQTASAALNQATLPFVLAIAEAGPEVALRQDPHLRSGLAVYGGQLVSEAVGRAHGLTVSQPDF
jgi:alanine dehydrogenase